MDPTRKNKKNNIHHTCEWIKFGRVQNGFEIRHNEYQRTLGAKHPLLIPVATFTEDTIKQSETLFGKLMYSIDLKAPGRNEFINVSKMKDKRIGIDDLIRVIQYVAEKAQRLSQQDFDRFCGRDDTICELTRVCTGPEGTRAASSMVKRSNYEYIEVL